MMSGYSWRLICTSCAGLVGHQILTGNRRTRLMSLSGRRHSSKMWSTGLLRASDTSAAVLPVIIIKGKSLQRLHSTSVTGCFQFLRGVSQYLRLVYELSMGFKTATTTVLYLPTFLIGYSVRGYNWKF